MKIARPRVNSTVGTKKKAVASGSDQGKSQSLRSWWARRCATGDWTGRRTSEDDCSNHEREDDARRHEQGRDGPEGDERTAVDMTGRTAERG